MFKKYKIISFICKELTENALKFSLFIEPWLVEWESLISLKWLRECNSTLTQKMVHNFLLVFSRRGSKLIQFLYSLISFSVPNQSICIPLCQGHQKPHFLIQ